MLSGNLRRNGRAIRVATQLTHVETGQSLWADRQGGREEEVFDLQDRIVQRIVAGMAPNIRATELQAALRKRPESLTAYDRTLRGVHLIYSWTGRPPVRRRLTWTKRSRRTQGFPCPWPTPPGGTSCGSGSAG